MKLIDDISKVYADALRKNGVPCMISTILFEDRRESILDTFTRSQRAFYATNKVGKH